MYIYIYMCVCVYNFSVSTFESRRRKKYERDTLVERGQYKNAIVSLYLSHSQHKKKFFYGKVLICSRLGRDLSHGLFPKKACPSNKLNGKIYLVVRCSIGVCHVALDHLSRSECLTSNLATWKTSDIEALSVVSLTSRLIISRFFFSEILQTHRRKNPSDGLSAGCC